LSETIYLEHLKLAAELGDVESQFEFARRMRQKWSMQRLENGGYTIWNVEAFDDELAYLITAAGARHPAAQRYYAKYLITGRPGVTQNVKRGIRLYFAGLLGALTHRGQPHRSVLQRILDMAQKSPISNFFGHNGRSKFTYGTRFDGAPSVCYVRSAIGNDGRLQVVAEQIAEKSIPSVTNSIESIATKLLYQAAARGVAIDPAKIDWYEAYPAGVGLIASGSLVAVRLHWNGGEYSDPQWCRVNVATVPLDLSDIIFSSESESQYGS
jgi:hypothetical protein